MGPLISTLGKAAENEVEMRTGFVKLMGGTIVALLGAAGVAAADDRGSMEDQMACTPDVYRLCSSFVPDESAITACLKQHIRALSPACQHVFTRPDSPATKDQSDD